MPPLPTSSPLGMRELIVFGSVLFRVEDEDSSSIVAKIYEQKGTSSQIDLK